MIITEPHKAIDEIEEYDFSRVAFDVETLGLAYPDRSIYGGEYGRGKKQPTGIAFYNGKKGLYIDTCGWNGTAIIGFADRLNKNFGLKGQTIIAHNLPFDLGAMEKIGVKGWNANLFDTLTAIHLLDENRNKKHGGPGNGLKQLAKEFLAQQEAIPWEKAKRDKETFHQYALNDAKWAYELAEKFERELKQEGLWTLFTKIEMPFQVCLTQMDKHGIKVDLERVYDRTEALYEDLVEVEKKMYDALGYQEVPSNFMLRPKQYKVVNYIYNKTLFEQARKPKPVRVVKGPLQWNSYPQMVELFTQDLELHITEETDKGNTSISESALEPLKEEHPLIPLYLEYKSIKKLLSAFFDPMPDHVDPDGRVRPNWHNTGTRTGRLSASRPNMQQTPRPSNDKYGVRESYVAKPGYKLLACDYSGQENCVLAHVSQDEKLMRILKDRKDLHLSVANDFMDLGIPDEKLYKTHPEFKHLKEEKFKEQRAKAKTITFGLAYGKSGYGFAKDFDIPESEGEQIVEDYLNMYPGVRRAMKQCNLELRKNGEVTHCLGRKRHFTPDPQWGYTNRQERQAFNFLIQGASADMIRLASARTLQLQGKHPEWELRMLLTVHDEVVLEVKEEYVEEAAQAVKEAFESLDELFTVPLEADVAWGDSYADCK